MTKGLEAFKNVLKQLFPLYDIEKSFDDICNLNENLSIIRNSLKAKELNVIDIIKEFVFKDLVFDDEEQSLNYSLHYFTVCKVIKDKEKYDLLKEVLS